MKRVVSRWQIVGLALNDVIGSGIYLLPAAAAAQLGSGSLLAVLGAGTAVLLIVLCFAEAASRFDQPGSAYLYAREAFGELVGFEVGWMTWLARVASVASLSVGFAQALSYGWPGVGGGAGRAVAVAVPLAGLCLINVVGVEAGVRTAVALVIGKVVPLVLFIGVGFFSFSLETMRGQPPGQGNLGRAALLLLFAYAGFENTPAAAGEYLDPRRDVPFALVVNIACVTGIYVAVQAVTLATLPNVAASATPLADAAQRFGGPTFGWLLTIGAALSILGTNSNTVLIGPRYLYALACDGFGPGLLARLSARYQTPAAAVVVQCTIALPLALSGQFAPLAALSVVARLATYLGTIAAVVVLRRRPIDSPDRPLRLPGGWAVPAAAAAVTAALAASAGPRALISAGVALIVGLPIYALRRAN